MKSYEILISLDSGILYVWNNPNITWVGFQPLYQATATRAPLNTAGTPETNIDSDLDTYDLSFFFAKMLFWRQIFKAGSVSPPEDSQLEAEVMMGRFGRRFISEFSRFQPLI